MFGSFAEYLFIPRAKRLCRIPDSVPFDQAAALGCRFTTAYRAIMKRAQLKPQESIVIFGCGGLGLACIMLASSIVGCQTIIGVDVSQTALQKASQLGATHTIIVRPESPDNDSVIVETITQIARGSGAHVTIEASGRPENCDIAIRSTRRAGRMIPVGLVPTTTTPISMGIIIAREIDVLGSHGFESDTDLPNLLQLVANRKLDPSKLIEAHVDLQQGVKILQNMDHTSPLGITMITQLNPQTYEGGDLNNNAETFMNSRL
jgi:alcohol dehydrogenase